jgi:lipopolysaccharide export LptBFGC system permease protein LptF
LYKRLILPLYIIVSGFIASCLIIKSRSHSSSVIFKSVIFILGFIFIIFSEGSTNIVSFHNFNKSLIAFIPFIASIIGYLVFISSKKLKFL